MSCIVLLSMSFVDLIKLLLQECFYGHVFPELSHSFPGQSLYY